MADYNRLPQYIVNAILDNIPYCEICGHSSSSDNQVALIRINNLESPYKQDNLIVVCSDCEFKISSGRIKNNDFKERAITRDPQLITWLNHTLSYGQKDTYSKNSAAINDPLIVKNDQDYVQTPDYPERVEYNISAIVISILLILGGIYFIYDGIMALDKVNSYAIYGTSYGNQALERAKQYDTYQIYLGIAAGIIGVIILCAGYKKNK